LILGIRFFLNLKEHWKEVCVSAAVGLSFFVMYFFIFKMFALQSGDIQFGLVPQVFAHLPGYFFLNWGAILIFGVAGIFWGSAQIPKLSVLTFLILCFVAINFTKESVGASEVTLKLGYFSILALLLFSAGLIDRVFASQNGPKKILVLVFLILVLPASVTWMFDEFNCQDVKNGRFTTYVSQQDMLVIDWIHKNVPPTAILANDAIDAQNRRVSIIPPFAERSVYLGDEFHARAFQIDNDEYRSRMQVVRSLFRQKTTQGIFDLAKRAGIQYLFISSQDSFLAAYEELLTEPQFSTEVENGGALLVRVK